MKTPVYLFALAIAFLAGCGNDSSKPAQTSGSNAVTPRNAAADYGAALANAQNLAVKTVDLSSLTQAINLFNTAEGRYPKDLDELVQTRYIGHIPDPPRGMKLSYDAASGTVKLVPE